MTELKVLADIETFDNKFKKALLKFLTNEDFLFRYIGDDIRIFRRIK